MELICVPNYPVFQFVCKACGKVIHSPDGVYTKLTWEPFTYICRWCPEHRGDIKDKEEKDGAT